jgi:cation:H+ antiporter
MLLYVGALIAGMVLLIAGAEWLVKGSSALARTAGVSDLVIGLTVVAFGTSTPELVVSLIASLKGSVDLSLANVVGSNTCNILLILGLSATISPLFATRGTVWKEIPFMLLATAALIVLGNDRLLDQAARSVLSRADGVILLLFFAVFLTYVAQVIFDRRREMPKDRPSRAWKPSVFVVLGLGLLLLGADLVVKGAVNLALSLGVSESLVGLTIVAVGTSLPELATSAVAAYRRNSEIAVGNIVGSNIFNVFLILGVSSVAAPLPCGAGLNADLAVMLAASVLLFLAMFLGKPKRQVQRVEGILFVVLYIAYVLWLVRRG